MSKLCVILFVLVSFIGCGGGGGAGLSNTDPILLKGEWELVEVILHHINGNGDPFEEDRSFNSGWAIFNSDGTFEDEIYDLQDHGNCTRQGDYTATDGSVTFDTHIGTGNIFQSNTVPFFVEGSKLHIFHEVGNFSSITHEFIYEKI